MLMLFAGLMGLVVAGTVIDLMPDHSETDHEDDAPAPAQHETDPQSGATSPLDEALASLPAGEEDPVPTGEALTGDAGDDTLSGGDGNDTLSGAAGDDQINGYDGNDSIAGEAGDDDLWGALGDDTLAGGAGDDALYGDTGADLLDGGVGEDTLEGGGGDDVLAGGEGNDSLIGAAGDDSLSGGAGDDALRGSDGNDTLTGEAGQDTLFGGNGDDLLNGVATGSDPSHPGHTQDGDGRDFLNGGAGDDTLIGGQGDMMSGGAGHDTFATGDWLVPDAAPPVITDFDRGEDTLLIQYDPAVHADPALSVEASPDAPDTMHVILDGCVVAHVQGVPDLTVDDITLSRADPAGPVSP